MAAAVYFDTSFFVWLASAGADDASTAVDQLNELRIGYVVSPTHVMELARAAARHRADLDLLERLTWFTEEPVRLDGASLDVLSLEGEQRRHIVDALDAGLARSTEAQAWDEKARRYVARPPSAAQAQADLGHTGYLTDDGKVNLEHVLSRPEFQPMISLFGITAEDLRSKERAADLSERMFAFLRQLAPEIVARIETHDAALAVSLATDGRVDPITRGTAPAKQVAGLGRSVRDAEHIAWFVANRERVALLQIDGPQWRLMAANAAHPLRVTGLDHRVFHATDLASAVRAVTDRGHLGR